MKNEEDIRKKMKENLSGIVTSNPKVIGTPNSHPTKKKINYDDISCCNSDDNGLTWILNMTHPTPVSFAFAMATPMAKLPTTAPKLLFPSIRAVPINKDVNPKFSCKQFLY